MEDETDSGRHVDFAVSSCQVGVSSRVSGFFGRDVSTELSNPVCHLVFLSGPVCPGRQLWQARTARLQSHKIQLGLATPFTKIKMGNPNSSELLTSQFLSSRFLLANCRLS